MEFENIIHLGCQWLTEVSFYPAAHLTGNGGTLEARSSSLVQVSLNGIGLFML